MANAIIGKGTYGCLKDGREFQIRDFQTMHVSEDGNICDGIVGVIIDGRYETISVSKLASDIRFSSLPSILY